ncbi:hypothetical protein ABZ307_14645 [Streptomyces griseorubiginosus]|uniref:hypothetical protein n=1 Tax=Streptomyces griseorubiginosus TaxID=67304 RepID=UPI0033AFA71D
MGASLLYQVLEPLPDAASALRRARALLSDFAEWVDEPSGPEVGPVVTVEQYEHACRLFTFGVFTRRDWGALPPDGPAEFRDAITRTGALRDGDSHRVEVELRPEFSRLWPLIEETGLQVELPGRITPPFDVGEEDTTTEAGLDRMVEAVGPLGFDVAWEGRLRGLPSAKLCGVQLCLNSVWTSQCTEPAPGTHAVYLSIGTRNYDVQDAWLGETGLNLGPALAGW